MSPQPVVLDISSDEEDAVYGSGKDSLDCNSSLDWLSKMLELEDEPWESKDVVDVDELNCTAGMQKLSSVGSFTAKLDSDDDSDDDCKVLDGDPDNPVEEIQNEGNGSDELLIVGEKGQVACRDFPHSRHLCATFPFGTTAHEKFCKLCHCYVCDVPAPCSFWGTGSSNVDHCHSSDKEEKWKLHRKALRHVNSTTANTENNLVVTPPIRRSGMKPSSMRVPEIRTYRNNLSQTMSSTSMHMGPWFDPRTLIPMRGPAPAQTSIPLQNCSSRIHTLHPCLTTSLGTPNLISQRRNQHTGIVHNIHRFTEHDRARKYSGIDGTRKECHGLSPELLYAHARGRMSGGAGFRNGTTKRPRTTITRQNQVYSRKVQRSSCLPAPSIDERLREWQDVLLGRDSNPETDLRQCGIYPQPKVDNQSYTQTGADIDTHLPNNPTLATSNPNCPDGGWLDAGSANAACHVSLANLPLPSICTVDLYAAPEGNSVPGGVPLEELIGCPGQDGPPQRLAGDEGLKERQCTYDDQELLNSLLHAQVNR